MCARLETVPLTASPHTRGWTRKPGLRQETRRGFPAHAGMDLDSFPSRGLRTRLPRTRGDGPAEMIGVDRAMVASPHTRGWTLALDYACCVNTGFPAHAGMDPSCGR